MSTFQSHLSEYSATRARKNSLIFIALNFALFAWFLVRMYQAESKSLNWPSPFQFGSLLMVFVMAMGGVCGSITAEVAAHSAAREKWEESVRWLAISMSSWLVFLFLEVVEWVRLVYIVNLGPDTSFGYTYFLLAGSHWIAVLGGVCWLTWVLTDVRRHDIMAAALYSHFLALWWIIIVVTMYWPNSNPLEGF